MWRFFGENAGGPSGTYYYERAEHVVYFWNIFDQILVRPTLIDCFEDDDLQIIDAVGQVKLTRADGRPNSNVGSDHLPILFEMDIPLEDANAERTAGTVAR
jgi:hypothetical protein